MTLSANTVWEVRTTGSDSSGGAFVAGSGGTDRSLSDTAFANGTNLTVDSVTNTDVAPDGYSPVSADVGNLIQITTTGTGAAFTVGFYQIASIQAGKWRLDRSPAATSSAGATWAMGGALLTLGKLAGAMAASNWAFIKAGTGYSVSAGITFSQSPIPTESVPPCRLTGYTTTRGDGGMATITLTAGTSQTVLSLGGGFYVENLAVDCGNKASSTGILLGGGGRCTAVNCKVSNYKTRGIQSGGSFTSVLGCEITGAAATGTGILLNSGNWAVGNNVHDTTGVGISAADQCHVEGNLVTNNTGATSDGIAFTDDSAFVCRNNTVYNSGRDGIRVSNFRIGGMIRNNVLAKNGGYGSDSLVAAPALPHYDGNAYWSNTSGARNNMDSTAAPYSAAPYTNVLDVTLTADPFTNAAGGDFTLNNTAGGGAACRGAGTPGAMPGVSQTGKLDMGCFQHADATVVFPQVINRYLYEE